MATSTESTSKPTMRQRIEELHARRHELITTKSRKWLAKQRLLQHITGQEMVSLSRDSILSKMPAELQLHVISFMDYPSVLKLKDSCRYFHYFINEDVLRDSKQYQIELFKVMERMRTLPTGCVPCYTCLHMLPAVEFYNNAGNNYYGSTSIYNRTGIQPPLDVFDRSCIRCTYKAGNFEPGLKLATKGENWMICRMCGYLCREDPALSYGSYGTCKPCSNTFTLLKDVGPGVRLMQFIISVIILPLACTGEAMPWTSIADGGSVRWICTIILDLLTIGGTFASWCTRSSNHYGDYSYKRSSNHRFVFPVELTAFVCWLAILVALFNEAREWHFTGRFDRFAKGLTAMTFIEVLLFLISLLWSNRYTQRIVIPSSRAPRGIV